MCRGDLAACYGYWEEPMKKTSTSSVTVVPKSKQGARGIYLVICAICFWHRLAWGEALSAKQGLEIWRGLFELVLLNGQATCNFLMVGGSIHIVPQALQLMLTILVTISVLSLLYGMAWHNRPARQPAPIGSVRREQGPHFQPRGPV
jgi:hypothetical protein